MKLLLNNKSCFSSVGAELQVIHEEQTLVAEQLLEQLPVKSDWKQTRVAQNLLVGWRGRVRVLYNIGVNLRPPGQIWPAV